MVSFLMGYIVLAWTEPSQAPPAGNVPTPLNTGGTAQTKEGGLIVATNSGVTYGFSVLYGSVGLGTTTPDTNYKLDVNGKIATPYIKSPDEGDVNKDGDINSYDIILVVSVYGCSSGDPCWTEQIGADNLGNYLYGKDADLNGDEVVDIQDVVIVSGNYKPRISPYSREPKTGDINKDGYVNHEDLYLVIVSYGCDSTDPCWTEQIGADNLGNRLYKKDADLNGDDTINIHDVTAVSGNYEIPYYLESQEYEDPTGPDFPAARFIGDVWVYDDNNDPVLFVKDTGRVGIGTDIPGSKLDVRGNIKLGTNGELFAFAGEENLRIVRGWVYADGTVAEGSGFTSTKTATGTYQITFDTPFNGSPYVFAKVPQNGHPGANYRVVSYWIESSSVVDIYISDKDGTPYDAWFTFIAIGPR
jgi:hypothetical protein